MGKIEWRLPAGYLAGLRRRACVDATLIRLSMEGAEQLPEWLRAPRPRRSKMAAIVHFLSSSASVTSRIEQFEHLTGSSGSRLASSTRTMLGSSSSMSMRPLSVPVPSSQRFSATESRQGIHFDDTSSESESPSKDFLLLCVGYFAKNESSILINFVCKSRNGEQLLITFLTEISQLIN